MENVIRSGSPAKVAAISQENAGSNCTAKSAAARRCFHRPGVVMLADVFTNYGSPERGMAAIRVLRALGLDVVLSPTMPDGRAAMSQGMMETRATPGARSSRPCCGATWMKAEKSSCSSPACWRCCAPTSSIFWTTTTTRRSGPEQLRAAGSGVAGSAGTGAGSWHRFFRQTSVEAGKKAFYHSHCQQRTCNSATQTVEVLRAAGFDVVTSSVECCGMAGSFGYKRDYYELSMAVGEDLFAQVRRADRGRAAPAPGRKRHIVSRAIVGRTGTRSCCIPQNCWPARWVRPWAHSLP